MKTTLNAIRDHSPCHEGWEKLLRFLGKTKADDEPLLIRTIIEANGLEDALWTLRAVSGHDREIRLYAVWCARRVEQYTTDQRVKACNDMTERYANSLCTVHDLEAARAGEAAAAWAAAWEAARAASGAAALAAAAWAAAWAAAGAAQSAELVRVCLEIEAGHDPYPVVTK